MGGLCCGAAVFGLWDHRRGGIGAGVDPFEPVPWLLGTLAIWGWIELTFLSGTITGPRRAPLRPNACGMDRFVQAWSVVAYHEGLLLVGFLGLLYLSLGTANPLAVWVYGILLGARVLAKLNLFHGVPGINIDAVPSPLSISPAISANQTPVGCSRCQSRC